MEAPYGKNPVYHVGKVYTYLAYKLARQLHEQFGSHITVALTSKMGNELSEPGSIVVEASESIDLRKAEAIIQAELSKKVWADEIIGTRFFVPTPGHRHVCTNE